MYVGYRVSVGVIQLNVKMLNTFLNHQEYIHTYTYIYTTHNKLRIL